MVFTFLFELKFQVPYYLLSVFLIWFSCRSGANSILNLGRSKNGYKKLKKSIRFKEAFWMYNYIEICKYEQRKMKYFMIINNIYIYYTFVFLNLIIISFFFKNVRLILGVLLILKIVIVDIPFTIFSFINTCHAPNGGVEWKFVRDYRKNK